MAEPFKPRRSCLFLPASNSRAIEKARTLAADVIVLDLEDAVAPESKSLAREQAMAAVRGGGFAGELVVRVNGLETEWIEEDLRALVEAPPAAVLVPKIGDGDSLRWVADRLKDAATRPALWAMIESARAILRLDEIAGTPDVGLACLVVGTNDLAKDLRARPGPDRLPLHPALALSVAAARAHGLTVLDGVFNNLEDRQALERECRQGVAFGFDGKSLIHPNQIDICNAVFSPSAEEIGWAKRVVAAFAEGGDKGVLRVDGAMVERLHLEQAEQILAFAGQSQK